MSRSSMNDTLIVVNFKTYQEAHGVAAEELAVIMQDLETSARMVALSCACLNVFACVCVCVCVCVQASANIHVAVDCSLSG